MPVGKAEKGVGQRLSSGDGRAALTIYSRENEDGDTPASYLKKNLRVARSALDYERVTRGFFAISLGAAGRDPVKPVQFLERGRRRDPLLRPDLPAGEAARLGRHRDPHQPLAASARRLKQLRYLRQARRRARA
ncbi:MAG: hypothetical protein WBW74_01250 [Xanthobacteraceae bacterium]